MRNFDETSITDAVVERVGQAEDPRTRDISEALVRHLHAFLREVRPTQAEWEQGIDFLTRTGHMCNDKRQEFILLSDTLGASMLVDAINNSAGLGETDSTVLGPFYVEGPKEFDNGADISNGMDGMPLYVSGSVSKLDGSPIAGAVVDIWHADDHGFYDVQKFEERGLAGRARLHTGPDGRFSCRTVRPASYPIPYDGPVGDMLKAQGRHPYRPAHVHFMISAPDCQKLVTHVFADGDAYLDSDVVFGVKDSIIRPFTEHPPGEAPDGSTSPVSFATLEYDFRLLPSNT